MPSQVIHSPLSRPNSVGSVHSAASDSASSGVSTGRGPKRGQDICVSEELRIAIDLAFDKFRNADPDEYHELEFPSSLTSTERAYIHRLAAANNLKSKSRGKNNSRYLTVTRLQTTGLAETAILDVTRNSQQQMMNLMQRCPLTHKEKQDLIPRAHKSTNPQENGELTKMTTGKLNNGLPQVPPRRCPSGVSVPPLPVLSAAAEIVHTVANNQVVLVSGETGCGKTTQVPQMILDSCCESRLPCRIICVQPRRIAALSMAGRVAAERGEEVGQIVGYQIRLESRVSPKTLLTYCTNGVLLRTLIAAENALATVTHVIVDEIHERDRLCDFLLIVLRQAISKYKNLKLILMSATMNTELFLRYFDHCPIIQVPGSLHDVEELYLEDVLKLTGYMSKKMAECKQQLEKVAQGQGRLPVVSDADETEHGIMHRMDDEQMASIQRDVEDIDLEGTDNDPLDPVIAKEMDKLLKEIWMTGNESLFSQIYHYILSENVSADYQDSETGMTPLMAACAKGLTAAAEQLLNLGANVHFKSISSDCTALKVASHFHQEECVELLHSHMYDGDSNTFDELPTNEIPVDANILLQAYHHSFDDEKIDVDLVLTLLQYIMMTSDSTGAILVFLPGFDDIVVVRERILADTTNFSANRATVFTLHSNIQISDQKKVFRRSPQGVRKIILATNIAETSLTIDDVVHVVDCGKVKEKSFDAFSNISMLRCNWISRASSAQRAGRAGRCKPGIAYHLFSSTRYKNMAPYQVAEMLRSPLQELCLQTKLLAPSNTGIADFLSLAPEPPSFLIARNAVQLLKQMDALDDSEDLTELGHHLVDIPISPRLGKMIIYSVMLKCLDPVLTIACTLAYKEPFVLPINSSLKRAAAKVRQRFGAESLSDHMTYLRVFQAWQKARADGIEKSFCEKNFVSSATMEMILGMRSLLLGQLRASGFVRARGAGDIRDLNTNSDCWAVVKAALCAGTYPNIMKVDRGSSEFNTEKENKVRFHPTSVLNQSVGKVTTNSHKEAVDALPTDWVIYEELCRSPYVSYSIRNFSSSKARCATAISPITLALFGGPSRLNISFGKVMAASNEGSVFSSDSEEDNSPSDQKATFSLDNWIKFSVDHQLAELIQHLRQKLYSLVLRKLVTPNKQLTHAEETVIKTIVMILTSEEQALGLKQPVGIGQRPRPMASGTGVGFSEYTSHSQHSDDSSSGSEQRRAKNRPGADHKRPSKNKVGKAGHSETSSIKSSSSNSQRSSTTNSPSISPAPAQLSKPHPFKSTSPCRYFVMSSLHPGMLELSQANGLWATGQATASRINAALQECQALFLVFTVQGSSYFHGLASVNGLAPSNLLSAFGQSNLTTVYFVNWIKSTSIPFTHTQSLYNVLCDNQPISMSRDGQELEVSVGEELVKLWNAVAVSSRGDNSHVTILKRNK